MGHFSTIFWVTFQLTYTAVPRKDFLSLRNSERKIVSSSFGSGFVVTLSETSLQTEYKKVYSRLKTRRYRGKLDIDEWNRQVALAQDYKEQAEKGEISEFELQRLYERI